MRHSLSEYLPQLGSCRAMLQRTQPMAINSDCVAGVAGMILVERIRSGDLLKAAFRYRSIGGSSW